MYLDVFLNTYMYGDAAAKHTNNVTASVFRGGFPIPSKFKLHPSSVLGGGSSMVTGVCGEGGGGGGCTTRQLICFMPV